MIPVWLFIVCVIAGIGIGIGAGYLIFYKKGCIVGSKTREKEILMYYVWYIPIKNIAEFAREAMEEKGVEDTFPLLVVNFNKYDYLDGDDVPGDMTK